MTVSVAFEACAVDHSVLIPPEPRSKLSGVDEASLAGYSEKSLPELRVDEVRLAERVE